MRDLLRNIAAPPRFAQASRFAGGGGGARAIRWGLGQHAQFDAVLGPCAARRDLVALGQDARGEGHGFTTRDMLEEGGGGEESRNSACIARP